MRELKDWELNSSLSNDGVDILFDYEGGWLVYEYTGFLKGVYPAKRAWIGHKCASGIQYGSGCGFVSAKIQGSNDCTWCSTAIPDEIHGVVALYNYGKEVENGDDQG